MSSKPEVADPVATMAIRAAGAKDKDIMWAGPLGWATVAKKHHSTPRDGRITFDTSVGPLECGGADWVLVRRAAPPG